MSIFHLIKLAPILCFKKYPVCGNGAKFTQTILLYLQRARDKSKKIPQQQSAPATLLFQTRLIPLPPADCCVGSVSLSSLFSSLLASIFSSLVLHARITRTGGRECFHRLQLNTKVSGIVQILRQFKVHLSFV